MEAAITQLVQKQHIEKETEKGRVRGNSARAFVFEMPRRELNRGRSWRFSLMARNGDGAKCKSSPSCFLIHWILLQLS